MSKKQDVAKAEEIKALATQEQYTGPTGLAGNITTQDLRLPRIALLQSKSPQVENDESGTYKAGMFIDTLTQDPLKTPVKFTPAFIFKNVIKWKPRSEGGGMIYKTMDFNDPKVLADLQWDGDKKPTADQYINVVAVVEGIDIPLILSFCKTSLKAGQDLLTLVQLSGCAWKHHYFLESQKVAGANGTYYVMKIKRGKPNTAEESAPVAALYEQVKDMASQIDTDYEGSTHETAPVGTDNAEPKEF
jgi:hypothetical protein